MVFWYVSAILNKLNGLLDQLHVSQRVESVQEISAGVLVTLYEGLCGEQLTGTSIAYSLFNFKFLNNHLCFSPCNTYTSFFICFFIEMLLIFL